MKNLIYRLRLVTATDVRKGISAVRIILLCHHFKAAIFVASCVVILNFCHLLDGLDIATFQLAVPQLFKASRLPDDYSNKFGSAKVITINDKLYETRFKQSSPLDRCELYDIFEKILSGPNKPKVLAVDLDLSPGPKEITEWGICMMSACDEPGKQKLIDKFKAKQKKNTHLVLILDVITDTPKVWTITILDEKEGFISKELNYSENEELAIELRKKETDENRIIELAKSYLGFTQTKQYNVGENELYRLLKLAKGVEIVLVTSDRVYSDDLITRKVQWMEDMCGEEHIRFGLPYLYPVKGVVLKHLSDPKSFAYQICRAASAPNKSGSPKKTICCDEDKQLNSFNRFVSAKASTGLSDKDLKELNFKFLDSIEPIRIPDNGTLSINTEKLKGQVVLLGGSYGSTDKYETPVGTLAGVFLHAASYYSVVNSVWNINKVIEYLLEILMSMVLGVAFYYLACWHWTTGSLHSIVINLVVQLLLMYLFIFLAGKLLLCFNLWIHPAPLIVGMEIHALYAAVVSVGTLFNDKNKLPCIHERIIKWFFGYGTSINEINNKNKPLCIPERIIRRIIDYVTSNIDRISYVKNNFGSSLITMGNISNWDALLFEIQGDTKSLTKRLLMSKLEETTQLEKFKTIDVDQLTDEMKEGIVAAFNAIKDNLKFYKDEVAGKSINLSPEVQKELNNLNAILEESGKLKKEECDLSDSQKEDIKWFNIAILKNLFPQILSKSHNSLRKDIKCCLCYAIVIASWACIVAKIFHLF